MTQKTLDRYKASPAVLARKLAKRVRWLARKGDKALEFAREHEDAHLIPA